MLDVPLTGLSRTGQPCLSANERTTWWSTAGAVAGTATPASVRRSAMTNLSRNGASSAGV